LKKSKGWREIRGHGGVLRLGFSRCGELASCLVDWWEMDCFLGEHGAR
jgi:hypothetical protein